MFEGNEKFAIISQYKHFDMEIIEHTNNVGLRPDNRTLPNCPELSQLGLAYIISANINLYTSTVSEPLMWTVNHPPTLRFHRTVITYVLGNVCSLQVNKAKITKLKFNRPYKKI